MHAAVLSSDMNESILTTAARLSDDALLARLEQLALRGRETCAELIAHLAELAGRRSHLGAGTGSLFGYCREVLKLSEHAAYHRIEAAHVARAFPVVIDLLSSGSVNLTTVALLRPVLTPENHRAVLDEASGRSKDEVKEIVARLRPRRRALFGSQASDPGRGEGRVATHAAAVAGRAAGSSATT